MFRLIRWLIVLIIIAFLIVWAAIWFAGAPLLGHFLSKKWNTEVTIDKTSLGWNSLTLKNFRVSNPERSHFAYAFETSQIVINAPFSNLWKEAIRIERVKIEDPKLAIELYNSLGSENNWTHILNDFPSSSSSKSSKKVIIERLSLINLNVSITRSSNGKNITLPTIPYLEFNNLESSSAQPYIQLAKDLFVKILEKLQTKQQLSAVLDHLSESTQKVLDETSNSTLEDVKNTMKEGIEAIKRKAEEAHEYLQDLFSK